MTIELRATPRLELGKKVKHLRKSGFLPAVVYGDRVPAQSLAIPLKEFERVFSEAGESTVVQLYIDHEGEKKEPLNVIIADVAYDAVDGAVLHTDFHAIRMDQAIRVSVPVEFIGESPAVKNFGGVLVKTVQELEVESLPSDLPHALMIDVSSLEVIDAKLFVKDITVPKGVKILADSDEVIALISAQSKEEVEVAPAATTPEIQTEREAKVAERAKRATTEESE